MKKLLFLLALSLHSWASVKDTTVVEFNDKGIKKRVSISTQDGKSTSFKIPKNLNLESLLTEMGVDSSERKKAIFIIESQDKNGKSSKDTLVAVSRDGKKIKIVIGEPKKEHTAPKDTSSNAHSRVYDNKKEIDQETEETAPPKPAKIKDGSYFSKTDFGVYLGLNNYTTSTGGSVPSSELYHLSVLGSRFFALSWKKNVTISKNDKTDLAIGWGPELAWNNYMFDGNDYVEDNNGKARFLTSQKALEKTKLTVFNVNLPVMVQVGFKESKFHFGAGAYVGYKLSSYSKQKYDSGGKDKGKGTFGLEDLQYGWTAEMGRKGRSTLFIRRNLTPLFQDNLGPNVTPWTVGFRF
jgi:hypothetical protein